MLYSNYELTVSYTSNRCISLFLMAREVIIDQNLLQKEVRSLRDDVVHCLVRARFHAVADILQTLPYKVVSDGFLHFSGSLRQRREIFHLLTPYRGKYVKTSVTVHVQLSRYPRMGEEDPMVNVEHWIGRMWNTQDGYENPPFLVKKRRSTLTE